MHVLFNSLIDNNLHTTELFQRAQFIGFEKEQIKRCEAIAVFPLQCFHASSPISFIPICSRSSISPSRQPLISSIDLSFPETSSKMQTFMPGKTISSNLFIQPVYAGGFFLPCLMLWIYKISPGTGTKHLLSNSCVILARLWNLQEVGLAGR